MKGHDLSYVRVSDEQVVETEPLNDDETILVDYGPDGSVVGVEFLCPVEFRQTQGE